MKIGDVRVFASPYEQFGTGELTEPFRGLWCEVVEIRDLHTCRVRFLQTGQELEVWDEELHDVDASSMKPEKGPGN